MYLSLKEIWHEKLRYGLIIGMILLVTYLVFILSALANGLAQQNTQAIESWDTSKVVLAKDSDINLSQSLLTSEQTKAIKLGLCRYNRRGCDQQQALGNSFNDGRA